MAKFDTRMAKTWRNQLLPSRLHFGFDEVRDCVRSANIHKTFAIFGENDFRSLAIPHSPFFISVRNAKTLAEKTSYLNRYYEKHIRVMTFLD